MPHQSATSTRAAANSAFAPNLPNFRPRGVVASANFNTAFQSRASAETALQFLRQKLSESTQAVSRAGANRSRRGSVESRVLGTTSNDVGFAIRELEKFIRSSSQAQGGQQTMPHTDLSTPEGVIAALQSGQTSMTPQQALEILTRILGTREAAQAFLDNAQAAGTGTEGPPGARGLPQPRGGTEGPPGARGLPQPRGGTGRARALIPDIPPVGGGQTFPVDPSIGPVGPVAAQGDIEAGPGPFSLEDILPNLASQAQFTNRIGELFGSGVGPVRNFVERSGGLARGSFLANIFSQGGEDNFGDFLSGRGLQDIFPSGQGARGLLMGLGNALGGSGGGFNPTQLNAREALSGSPTTQRDIAGGFLGLGMDPFLRRGFDRRLNRGFNQFISEVDPNAAGEGGQVNFLGALQRLGFL